MGTEEYLLQKARTEGREEWLEKGREEGKLAFVKNLLADTDFTIEAV